MSQNKIQILKKAIFVFILFKLVSFNPVLSQFVKQNGQLHVEGVQLKNQHNEDVVLHGMSFGWHNWWPRFYNAGTIKWLVNDWKCNVIRAAMGVEPKKGYLRKPEWTLKTITPVIDAAITNDVYIIIDWHSHHIFTNEAKAFFADIAKKYGNRPNIIYEIYNEPIDDSWNDVKAYAIEVIKEIRKYDPDNLILIGNPHWSQDIHLVAENPITGFNNIMYTVHFYAGTHKKWLRDRTDEAIQKGIPIFVSECGDSEASGNGPINREEWKEWTDWMDKYKISWCKYCIADKDETCSVLYPSASSTGNWTDKDLKESGVLARKQLIEYHLKTMK